MIRDQVIDGWLLYGDVETGRFLLRQNSVR